MLDDLVDRTPVTRHARKQAQATTYEERFNTITYTENNENNNQEHS